MTNQSDHSKLSQWGAHAERIGAGNTMLGRLGRLLIPRWLSLFALSLLVNQTLTYHGCGTASKSLKSTICHVIALGLMWASHGFIFPIDHPFPPSQYLWVVFRWQTYQQTGTRSCLDQLHGNTQPLSSFTVYVVSGVVMVTLCSQFPDP